jgi:hypothetical protein
MATKSANEPQVDDPLPCRDLLIAVYTNRREDIEQRITLIEKHKEYGLLATGAVWAWVLADSTQPLFKLVVWIPLFIGAAYTSFWWLQHRAIMSTSRFIREVEKALGLPDKLSWEEHAKGADFPRLERASFLYWMAFNVGNALVALILCRTGPWH